MKEPAGECPTALMAGPGEEIGMGEGTWSGLEGEWRVVRPDPGEG